MKCFCLAGYSDAAQQIYSVLEKCGMQGALPSRGQPSLTMCEWYQQVGEILESEEKGGAGPLGRMWEHLASEIFLANGERDWGWVNEGAYSLLPFWRSFDPRVKFILLFKGLGEFISDHVERSAAKVDLRLDVLLQLWSDQCSALLRFGVENRERCLMLDADEAVDNPAHLVDLINSKWGWGLDNDVAASSAKSDKTHGGGVLKLLVERLLDESPNAAALQKKIRSNTVHLTRAPVPKRLDPLALFSDYVKLCDRTAELREISLLKEQQVRFDQMHSRLLSNYQQQVHGFQERQSQNYEEIRRLRNELGEVRGLHSQEVGAARVECDALRARRAKLEKNNKTLESRLAESVEENELLLAFLHQTQEELESFIQEHEKFKESSLAKTKQLSAKLGEAELIVQAQVLDIKRRDAALEKLKNELESENVQLVNELRTQLLVSTEENSLLLMLVHDVQEEMESLSSEAQRQRAERRQEVNTLIRQISELKHSYDLNLAEVGRLRESLESALAESRGQEAKAAELHDSLEMVMGKMEGIDADLSSARQQVKRLEKLREEQGRLLQESQDRLSSLELYKGDLERQIVSLTSSEIRRAELERKLEEGGQRYAEESQLLLLQLHQIQEELERAFGECQRLEVKYSAVESRLRRMQQHYPDYIECGGIEAEVVSLDRVQWCLTDLSLGEGYFDRLRFSTVLEHGMAGFVFDSESAAAGFFTDWSAVAGSNDTITLLPLGTHDQVEERSGLLLRMSVGDWANLLALTDALIFMLERNTVSASNLGAFDAGAWRKGLRALKADLIQFPAIPRFDRIRLKRNQVNFDYEHLWLSFENFNFQGNTWGNFEFRLSCANVRPDVFGRFPKIEFPAGEGESPFDSWFAESSDDFGDKLELRYALPDSMDLGVWHRLSGRDRSLLVHLIRLLPIWLRRLESAGVKISRSWDSWCMMAEEMRRITSRHAAGGAVPASPSVAARSSRGDPILDLLEFPASADLQVAELSGPTNTHIRSVSAPSVKRTKKVD